MCLAVPMQVLEIDGTRARCTALGQERWGDLTLVPDAGISVGDYVIIHLGFVQNTLPAEQALESIKLFEQILAELPPTGT